jgi:hypothetical protein
MNSEPRVTFIRDPDVVMPSTPITTDTPIDVNVMGGTLVANVVVAASPQPIKDGVGAALSAVQAANGATAVSTNVLLVQHVDDEGNTLRETTQDNIDLNTANTALVMLDLDETGSRQLSAIQGVQTSITGLATDQSAIRMSGTRVEGLLVAGSSNWAQHSDVYYGGQGAAAYLDSINSKVQYSETGLATIVGDPSVASTLSYSGKGIAQLVGDPSSSSVLSYDSMGVAQLTYGVKGSVADISTNTTNLPADQSAIRMSGTRVEAWLSRINALETTIASNTANFAGTVVLRDPVSGRPISTYGEPDGGRHIGVTINQDVIASIINSSATALPFGGTFLGQGETTLGVNSVQVSIKADQNATVKVDQSPDGNNWDISDSYNYYWSLGGASWTTQAVNSYYRVHVANSGTGNMSYMRMQTALCPIVEALPRALTAAGNLRVAAEEFLPTFGESTKATPHNQLQIAQTYRLAGATFSGTNPVDSVDTQ